MSEAIYPTIRNAVFSAIMDHFGWEDGDEDSFATELTDQIMEALCHVEGVTLIDGYPAEGEPE